MGECARWFEVTDGQQYPKQALIKTEVCWRPSPRLQTMKQREYGSGGPHWVAPLPADGQETEASPHRLTKIGKPRPALLSHSSCRDLDSRVRIWRKQHEKMDWASCQWSKMLLVMWCRNVGGYLLFPSINWTLFKPHGLSRVLLPTTSIPLQPQWPDWCLQRDSEFSEPKRPRQSPDLNPIKHI